ncbi:hypothetical protein OSB04_015648 [Centaurea solstitialis]|uniref:F-box domain-containing protein n=1 Tax=Centaurea solstitialis TaxID=347529 RepID=A0AA38TJG2_9ASTR|nr:hypothetical protein OSB04_015648 [Centaurea solstitialis]
MEDLPTELTMDILSRLPVKTIIHCKFVCKKWRNLVSDSSFVNLHLSGSPTVLIIHCHPLWCMSCYSCETLEWLEIEDKVDHRHLHHDPLMKLSLNENLRVSMHPEGRIHLMGSVNGLICLWQSFPKSTLNDTYICNPITREYIILQRQDFRRDRFGLVLYGFGVSSLTGEYKVVRAFQWKSLPNDNKPSQPSLLEVEVYTIGTGQWRSLGPFPVTYRINALQEFYGPFLNNHCHWIVPDNEDVHHKICTFDLDKETFQLFPSPPLESIEENRCHHQGLAILKGCLCKHDTYDSKMIIWVMKEYGIKNSWHKEVVIRLQISIYNKWMLVVPVHLIAGLKDGSILMVFGCTLCVFDPRSETIEDTKMFYAAQLGGLAYHPSFLKLQHFESERVHTFYTDSRLLFLLPSKILAPCNVNPLSFQFASDHQMKFRDWLDDFYQPFLNGHMHWHVKVEDTAEKGRKENSKKLPVKEGKRWQRKKELKSMAEFSPRTLIHPSMEDLPEELTMDILSRLPVKTIFHCKLVCKKWRNLVSDSSFVNLHLSRSPTGLIIHHTDQGTFKWVEIVDNVDHHHLHEDYPRSHSLYMSPVYQHYLMYQTGSVNGLICVCPYSRKTNHDDAYICNPVTREFVILPRQRFWIEGLLEVIYGFGVSSLTGEYKVVRAYQAKGVQNGHKPARPSVLEAEVYTLGTGQWRSLCHVPVTYRLNTFQGFDFDVPFLNNRCHWIVYDYEDAHDKICTFDLDKETFQLLPSPPPPVKENRFHGQSLAILKGCLCKLDTYDSEVAIWVMKEYGINNSWHKQVVISRTIQWPFYEPMHLITAWPKQEGTSSQGNLPLRTLILFLQNFNQSNHGRVITSRVDMDILSRLPVKTIIHCKLVCKKWLNLVSDSSFVNLHLSRSPTGFVILQKVGFIVNQEVIKYPGILKWVEIEDKVDHHRLHYETIFDLNMVPGFKYSLVDQIGSVNGLIFLPLVSYDNTFICNPVTREIIIIPSPKYYKQDFTILAYGFGVGSLTGEYKVVRTLRRSIRSNDNEKCWIGFEFQADVYTLGTGQWRSLGRIPYKLYGLDYAAVLNDHCHWIVSDRDAPEKICTFDLNKETFQLFASPSGGSPYYLTSLAVLKGCLCKCDAYDSQITIWVMKEYGNKESWHKEVVITEALSCRPLLVKMSPIEGLKDGTIVFVSRRGGSLCAFYPRGDRIEDLETFDRLEGGLAYRPSFIKLQNFESEMVLMF